jgi:hypothetical protein
MNRRRKLKQIKAAGIDRGKIDEFGNAAPGLRRYQQSGLARKSIIDCIIEWQWKPRREGR